MTPLVKLGIWDIKDKAEVYGPEEGMDSRQARAIVGQMPRYLRDRLYRMFATIEAIQRITEGKYYEAQPS